MSNWFWPRSSHPFSSFTITSSHVFFSLKKNLLYQPPSAPPLLASSGCLCWMWSRAAGAQGRWRNHSPIWYLQAKVLHSSSALCYGRPLSSPFPAATWSLLHFQLLSLLALQHWSDLPTPVRTAEVPLALLEKGWKFISLKNTSCSPQPPTWIISPSPCLSPLLPL